MRQRPVLVQIIVAAAALATGLGLGLLYTWVISPVQYIDTTPNSLRPDLRAGYARLAARAYAVDGDLNRAQARLALIGLGVDPAQAAAALAQQAQANGDQVGATALARLASAFGAGPAAAGSPTATTLVELTSSPTATASVTKSASPTRLGTSTPTATATPSPTASRTSSPTPSLTPSASPRPSTTPLPTDTIVPSITPNLLPTRTPTPTPAGPFEFVGQQMVCDVKIGQPLIQVVTEGSGGKQVPGVEVVVTWDAGFDHFYTGLKPEQGQGYGDFTMSAGIDYSVHLAESPSATVDGLSAPNCTDAGRAPYLGSWLLVYRQK